ncbi:MAG: hypothetical protein DMD65_13955 [Gemmatimonadetes bacterium]|nr:MAG: hypothetical protein DMD65_13955 [Gemmatimonadota bacterium]
MRIRRDDFAKDLDCLVEPPEFGEHLCSMHILPDSGGVLGSGRAHGNGYTYQHEHEPCDAAN